MLWVYHIWLLLCWGKFLICLVSGGLFYFILFCIINECWSLSEVFYASIEIIIWFLSFNLLMWCIILIDLQILKNFCIPEIKSTWSWCMIFLICYWILFARIFLRIFAPMFVSVIGLQFPFFVAWLFISLLSLFQIWSEKVLSRSLQGGFPRSL